MGNYRWSYNLGGFPCASRGIKFLDPLALEVGKVAIHVQECHQRFRVQKRFGCGFRPFLVILA